MWRWDYDPKSLPGDLSEILIDDHDKPILSIGGDGIEGFYIAATGEDKRLIAAPPDILRALKTIYYEFGDNWPNKHKGMAELAIAKAEGRQ